MPTAPEYMMNRRLLGRGGFALSDDDYVRVIAGLGAFWLNWTSRASGAQQSIGWTAQNLLLRRRAAGSNALPATWLEHRDAWQSFLKGVSSSRVLVQTDAPVSSRLDLADIVRVLAHPAVGASSVFLDWSSTEADLRWQWPLRLGAFADDFEALALAALRDDWPARNLIAPSVLTRDAARVEVLVIRADARGALARILGLKHNVRAGFLLLLSPIDQGWRAMGSQVDALLAETQAGGLAFLDVPGDSSVRAMLNEWATHLSHNIPFDHALAKVVPPAHSLVVLDRELIDAAAIPVAALAVGRRLQQMPQHATLRVPDETRDRIGLTWTHAKPPAVLGAELEARATAGDLSYQGESHGASAIAEIEAATRESDRDWSQGEASRFLQATVSWWTENGPVQETRGLAMGQRYSLDVFIGEAGLGAMTADEIFPDDQINWPKGESLTLQVLFAEPRQWAEPMLGKLEISRTGVSSICQFAFSPTQAGPFAGRVTLYYRGRVLQTALLETMVAQAPAELVAGAASVHGMTLRVEALLRRSMRTLDERRRFDAFLVCNHTATHQAAVTAAGRDGAYIASLDTIGANVSAINGILAQVAHDTRTYSKGLSKPGNAELLTKLAFEGNALYRTLVIDNIQRSSSAAQVQSAEYVQIVTMGPEAIVPLEFVYEYPLPVEGAPVCQNAAKALKLGACPSTCRPTGSPALHVCPMGFWGLSKVIERHIHVPDLTKTAKVIGEQPSEPIVGRDELSLNGATLLATSRQVPARKSAALDKTLRLLRRGTIETVRDWADWQRQISDTKPIMLIVLPHADGSGANISLEIGGNALKSAYIDRSYVHVAATPPPLAILLGCDTANTANTDAYLRHIDVFRQADAALVLGTVTTVLGADAAEMTKLLVTYLTQAMKSGPARFGEVLREAKRAAVADSLMIALCLVAFGDADWKLSA